MTGLWKHQRDEVNDHALDTARALFWEPRVGKSRATIESVHRMILEEGMMRVLVVGPIMALRMTWASEVKQGFRMDAVDLTQGTIAKRAEMLQALRGYGAETPQIVLVNYEVLKALEPALLKWSPQVVIADEAHLIKSASAKRTKVMVKLGRQAQYRRVLTGTPTPRSYIDLYSQYLFLDPTIFGTSKKRFEQEYCYTHPTFRSKIIGYKNLPELERKAFSIASRVTRAECFDLPEVQEIERCIELPAKAKVAYDQMMRESVLEMEGLPYVDATHKLSRLVKLQKLCSGFITDDNDDAVWVHRAKIDAVLEELEDHIEAGEKIVVSYIFRHEGAELEAAIRAQFKNCEVDRLSGQTPQKDRARITEPFSFGNRNQGRGARVLIVQEAVGGLGISLASADHMIISSSSMDAAAHSQLRDRIWSPSKKITYTYLRVPNSVDTFIKRILATKDQASRALLDIGFQSAASGEFGCDNVAA